MASYLEGYGVEEERRNRAIRHIFFSIVAVVLLSLIAYWVLKDHTEKQVAKQFLTELNDHNYQKAYSIWCPKGCEHYDYARFAADWGGNRNQSSPWKVQSTDSCKAFLTVNVTADGADVQSLSVQRGTNVLSFAPAPECQEYQWHWKQFFRRVFRSGQS